MKLFYSIINFQCVCVRSCARACWLACVRACVCVCVCVCLFGHVQHCNQEDIVDMSVINTTYLLRFLSRLKLSIDSLLLKAF